MKRVRTVWFASAVYGGQRAHLYFATRADAMRWVNKHDTGSVLLHADEARSLCPVPVEVAAEQLGSRALERRLGRHFRAPRGAVG